MCIIMFSLNIVLTRTPSKGESNSPWTSESVGWRNPRVRINYKNESELQFFFFSSTSATDNIFSMLAEEVKRDGGDTEVCRQRC